MFFNCLQIWNICLNDKFKFNGENIIEYYINNILKLNCRVKYRTIHKNEFVSL